MSGPPGNGNGVPLAALQQQFEATKEANQGKLAELERQGVAMDPFSFVHARIDRLIDSIAQFAGPNGPRWAVLTRLVFEQHIAQELATVENQSRKAQLAMGAKFTPGMIAELARQSGLFRARK